MEEEPLMLEDLEKPEPHGKKVRIRVKTCGVCRTDLHIAEGDLPAKKMPLVLGHQVVGHIDALGERAKRFSCGERVGGFWLAGACKACTFCRSGLENLCDSAEFTGYTVDGGYEEYMLADEDFLVPIPESFSDEHAAPLLCAGIIGYRSLKLSGAKKRLGIFGFGSSAHIVIQLAKDMETYVFTRSEEHRELARKLGATWVGGTEDNIKEKLDGAIVFAPSGKVVKDALRFLEKGATVAINAVHLSPIPPIEYDLIYGERKITSVANVTRKDAEEFFELAEGIKTEIELFSLDELNSALRLLKGSRINGSAVVKID
ncbi:MAG: zinc-dependent alcohol dehydrogenase family protein [Candidatus Thermoplasmatota archaeon]|nr:zinc-dependent alcohol dehydrogenase family protein [Candidatus Thermoplasmatota archaeon]